MTTDTSEKAFQNDIIAHLVSTGYHKRGMHNYNKATCLDPELVLKFILDTQEKEFKKYKRMYKDQAESKFLSRLIKEIDKKVQFMFCEMALKMLDVILSCSTQDQTIKRILTYSKSLKLIFSL